MKKQEVRNIVPIGNGGLLNEVIKSPFFFNFGQREGDVIALERADGTAVKAKRGRNRTITKASIARQKFHQTLYDNGTDVGGYSNKNK